MEHDANNGHGTAASSATMRPLEDNDRKREELAPKVKRRRVIYITEEAKMLVKRLALPKYGSGHKIQSTLKNMKGEVVKDGTQVLNVSQIMNMVADADRSTPQAARGSQVL